MIKKLSNKLTYSFLYNLLEFMLYYLIYMTIFASTKDDKVWIVFIVLLLQITLKNNSSRIKVFLKNLDEREATND